MKTKKVDVVAGYSYPNDKNALWFDQNTNTMRYWDGEKWESSQSEGSSLPTPTAEDDSKIMQVTPVYKGTKTEEIVIVPEQTCNMQEAGKFTICTLQNVDESLGEGFSGIAILDGIEYDVEWPEGFTYFDITEDVTIGHIVTDNNFELIDKNHSLTHTIKVITRETKPIYDYNWAPGVKIPVPTAEDEGKILVVAETEGNTFTIVPEQPVPADIDTPLTDVDLTKFVAGNTVKVTITYGEEQGGEFNGSGTRGVKSANSETFTATGVIILDEGVTGVEFYIQELDADLTILKIEDSLTTDAYQLGRTNSTIKLEYIELNYEYQLQENSGGSSGSSNILYCEGSDAGHGSITAYIDSSELDNQQITTIVVNIEGQHYFFYRMSDHHWLVSGFSGFSNPVDWIKPWNTEGQYPTIAAYFSTK